MRGEIRREVRDRRRAQPEKDSVCVTNLERLRQSPEYDPARTVAAYLDVRDEVRTRQTLIDMIAEKPWLALPWCDGDHLQLWATARATTAACWRMQPFQPACAASLSTVRS